MQDIQLVSVHGGHSGEFCLHATDNLEDIVRTYIKKGYSWVGITEHAPGISEELLYPDQQEAGYTPAFLIERFGRYMKECRRLQEKYSDTIEIFAAMEIETYSGYEEFVPYLVDTFAPDYLVGSVHFVDDMGFDYSPEQYEQTAAAIGDKDTMYMHYFDMQYDMIQRIKPAVVGHFDLIRLFDTDYIARLQKPAIAEKVERNLQLIKQLDLILDFNLRSLLKGAREPYITNHILDRAIELEIALAPGDDSHGISNVGLNMEKGLALLQEKGYHMQWKKPA
jgi:histidinol-phosphatase (PHP family)